MNKVNKFLQSTKGKFLAFTTLSMSFPFVAFADEATTTAMTGAMETIKTDAIGAIASVAPIGLSIMGVFLVWRYGIKFFKSISK